MPVPLFDTRAARTAARGDRARIAAVVEDGRFILGPNVAAFEQEFAAYVGAAHAIGVANGTDAITIALRAIGVGPGDEVIVPSFTFYASAEAIPPTGRDAGVLRHRPRDVLRDRRHGAGGADAEDEGGDRGAPVRQRRAGRRDRGARRAGARGRRAGRRVAQPRGRPGALGTAATFSFFPSKNLGAFGDGGAITTCDGALADRVRMLRFHGSRDKVTYEEVGYNSRLDELQAAILRVQLPAPRRLGGGRRAAGRQYARGRAGRARRAARCRSRAAQPAWHLYVVRHPRAPTSSRAALRDAGIGAQSRTTARRSTASRRSCATPRARAAGDRRGRAHAPGDPDERRAHAEQAAEVTAAARAVLAAQA